jgi:spermidine synthase
VAHRATLYLTVFVGGMTTLAVELAASRLLAPFFGTSLLIWANLIGLILIYLTAGYYLGGRLADRFPQPEVLYQVTAWAGFLIGLVPFVAQPILRASIVALTNVSAGLFLGSLFGVIALFAVPVVLLGTVSPFAIRLSVREVATSGNVVGGLYALSTLGSILGTFVPVLVLIPTVGTRRTFLLFSVALLVTSLIGLVQVRPRLALAYSALLLAVAGLGVFGSGGLIKAASGVVYEGESPYHYIQVLERNGARYLTLNEGQAVHSVYHPGTVLTNGVWDFFLLAPLFTPADSLRHERGGTGVGASEPDVWNLALIGLAGGTIAWQYTAAYGPIPIDGVEIDPQVVEVGRRYFGMNEPNLNVVVADGRTWLATAPGRYDVIGIDAYRQPYVPFHLTTVEFFRDVRDHLTDNGVAVINVVRTDRDLRLVDALASTMRRVFANVYVIDVPDVFNSLVIGTVQPSSLTNYADNVTRLRNPLLLNVAQRAAGHVREFRGTGPVFTDDLAPVEEMVDQMILNYVQNGQ